LTIRYLYISFRVKSDREFERQNFDIISKIEINISRRIYKKVGELTEDPFFKDIKKLKGVQNYRLRVGDYRIIFEIQSNTITILKIGHRKNIYEK